MKPMEIVHTELCGPMRKKGLEGELYSMLLLDDYTRMGLLSQEKITSF